MSLFANVSERFARYRKPAVPFVNCHASLTVTFATSASPAPAFLRWPALVAAAECTT